MHSRRLAKYIFEAFRSSSYDTLLQKTSRRYLMLYNIVVTLSIVICNVKLNMPINSPLSARKMEEKDHEKMNLDESLTSMEYTITKN